MENLNNINDENKSRFYRALNQITLRCVLSLFDFSNIIILYHLARYLLYVKYLYFHVIEHSYRALPYFETSIMIYNYSWFKTVTRSFSRHSK